MVLEGGVCGRSLPTRETRNGNLFIRDAEEAMVVTKMVFTVDAIVISDEDVFRHANGLA